MKPKWQEDSSCVFAYYFYRGTCHRRDTAGKESAPKSIRRRSRKKHCKSRQDDTAGKIVKGEASSRPVCRSQSAAPAIRGIAHPPIRRRADHRTPAEPSAAEFSGLVSAVAHMSRGQRPPYRSVLTWHK